MQVMQVESPLIEQPPRLYGTVQLHDGTLVDSGSAAWQLECLARHLMTRPASVQAEWMADWPDGDAVEMRLLMGALRATDLVSK